MVQLGYRGFALKLSGEQPQEWTDTHACIASPFMTLTPPLPPLISICGDTLTL